VPLLENPSSEPTAEARFIHALGIELNIQFDNKQWNTILELLGEFEELKFQQTGLRNCDKYGKKNQ